MCKPVGNALKNSRFRTCHRIMLYKTFCFQRKTFAAEVPDFSPRATVRNNCRVPGDRSGSESRVWGVRFLSSPVPPVEPIVRPSGYRRLFYNASPPAICWTELKFYYTNGQKFDLIATSESQQEEPFILSTNLPGIHDRDRKRGSTMVVMIAPLLALLIVLFMVIVGGFIWWLVDFVRMNYL